MYVPASCDPACKAFCIFNQHVGKSQLASTRGHEQCLRTVWVAPCRPLSVPSPSQFHRGTVVAGVPPEGPGLPEIQTPSLGRALTSDLGGDQGRRRGGPVATVLALAAITTVAGTVQKDPSPAGLSRSGRAVAPHAHGAPSVRASAGASKTNPHPWR